MKVVLKYAVPILLLSLYLYSCTKEKNTNNGQSTTSLAITLKDENGHLITQNCHVRLYRTIEDWSKDSNSYQQPQFPNAEGKVLFDNLEAQKYYWRISTVKGNNCSRNNFNDNYSDMGLNVPLTVGEKRQVTAFATPKGSYAITNSTANAYKIFINGTEKGNITGHGIYSDPYVKTGNYTIRTVPQTGSTGIDSTFIIQVICGQMAQVTI
ncbi:MAG: hypothetical protein EOP54_04110 [Sphingobacteriales bacterium]|nr:MAG: hypothetical protein EOP54_04110 [Sphingobacteriales bacterium]